MNLGQAIARFRVLTNDRRQPYKWPAADVVGFIAEAERETCLRSQLLRDGITADCCQIVLPEGDRRVALSPLVIDVLWAKTDPEGEALAKDDGEVLEVSKADGSGTPRSVGVLGSLGETLTLIADRAPKEDTTLYLYVVRFPLRSPDPENYDTEDTLEIAPDLHERMMQWAVHLAFIGRDVDYEDKQRAERAEKAFNASFGERPSAAVRRKRLRHRARVCQPIDC